MYQSVHRTYVPHHIYNEIPVLSSETRPYPEQPSQELNDNDERMLEEYERLYTTYMEEKKISEELRRRLQEQANNQVEVR